MSQPLDAELLGRLQAMSEQALVKKVLLPLFRTLPFDRVELRHGPLEKGVDILCIGRDVLGFPDLLAVQAKKVKISGAISSSRHIEALFRQLKQALREPITLQTGESRRANSAWLVTPFEVPTGKLETAFSEYCDSLIAGLRVVDGPRLLDLLRTKAPHVLNALGDKTHAYLNALRDRVLVLREASALGIETRPLSEFLVEPRLVLRFLRLGTALKHGSPAPKHEIRVAHPDQQRGWEHFAEECQAAVGASVGITLTKAPSSSKRATLVVTTDGHQLFSAIRHRVTGLADQLRVARRESSVDTGEALRSLCLSAVQLEDLLSRKEAPCLVEVPNKRPVSYDVEATARELLSSRVVVQLVGDAGFGKTTLLRYLCSLAIDAHDRLPVFVTLSSVGARQSVLSAVSDALTISGYPHSRKHLTDALSSGKVVLFFDGLDEAVPRTPDLPNRILSFREEFPQAQIILSTRPWAALRERHGLTQVLMQPFTREQLATFFLKWFPGDQASALSILKHIDEHSELSAPFSTPLVAALLAVVKSRGGQLPRSLPEVYDRRLDLLLSAWDSVKGVRRDTFDPQDKRFFLKKLAFRLHSLRVRSATRDTVLKLVRDEVPRPWNTASVESFVDELIRHNNVLFEEAGGTITFGHLQYQEHLTALEARENPRANIAEHLTDGWWWGALKMYAQLTSDVSALIEYAAEKGMLDEAIHELDELVSYAPNTSRRSQVIVTRFVEQDAAAAAVFPGDSVLPEE